jgi:hypothetical protein
MSARATPAAAPTLPPVSALTDPAAEAAIGAACTTLHLPTIRAQAAHIADAAARERLSHRSFLAEVLTAECDDRDSRRRIRRVLEAKFPRTKRLQDLDLTALPGLPPATLAHLAGLAWIDAGEPVVVLGDSGTGLSALEDPAPSNRAIPLRDRGPRAGRDATRRPPPRSQRPECSQTPNSVPPITRPPSRCARSRER